MNTGITPPHEHSGQPTEGQQPQQMAQGHPSSTYVAQPVAAANAYQIYPSASQEMSAPPAYEPQPVPPAGQYVQPMQHNTQYAQPMQPNAQYAQPMQPTAQYPQSMQPNGQYATPVNTNATVPIDIALKSINPEGSCCFCFGYKTGVMVLAILTAIFSLISIFLTYSVLNVISNLIVAGICGLGAYWIHNGLYKLVPIYAVFYAVISIVTIVLTFVSVAITKCPPSDSACSSAMTSLIAGYSISTAIRVYFMFVTIDYTVKLRREAARMTGTQISDFCC